MMTPTTLYQVFVAQDADNLYHLLRDLDIDYGIRYGDWLIERRYAYKGNILHARLPGQRVKTFKGVYDDARLHCWEFVVYGKVLTKLERDSEEAA